MAVTFNTTLYDEHPNTLQLLTYGNELLTTLLETVPDPEPAMGLEESAWPLGGGLSSLPEDQGQAGKPAPQNVVAASKSTEGRVLRCWAEGLTPTTYYVLDSAGRPQRIKRLADRGSVFAAESNGRQWSKKAMTAARSDFEQELSNVREQHARVRAARQRAERLALEEQARQILLQAALVELAMGQQPDLFGEAALPAAFTEVAITGLKRHGYPFAPLLRLVNVDDLRPSPADPFYAEMQGRSREALRGQFAALGDRAGRLVEVLAGISEQQESLEHRLDTVVETSLF